MNERIKELAVQAEILVTEVGVFHNTINGAYQLKEEQLKQFAELIIKETLEVARAGIEYGDGMEDAVENYFGVKL